jgi:hypothetical protein
MLVAASWHLLLGTVGLILERSFPIGSGQTLKSGSDHIFGIFEGNGWHSLAALVLGVVTAYFTVYPGWAREAALAIGGFHVGLVLALVLWPPETFWLASNAADQVVHTSTAVAGIVAGIATPRKLAVTTSDT